MRSRRRTKLYLDPGEIFWDINKDKVEYGDCFLLTYGAWNVFLYVVKVECDKAYVVELAKKKLILDTGEKVDILARNYRKEANPLVATGPNKFSDTTFCCYTDTVNGHKCLLVNITDQTTIYKKAVSKRIKNAAVGVFYAVYIPETEPNQKLGFYFNIPKAEKEKEEEAGDVNSGNKYRFC